MAEETKIAWAHSTFNPWIGCTKISAACDHCYAEAFATQRLGATWGPHAERRRTAMSTWKQPYRWNAKAAINGEHHRVFCASLADVFDNQVPSEWRDDLWEVIRATRRLTWMLLTKRPSNILKMLPDDWGAVGYPNVWLGTTVENQAEADRRIAELLRAPAACHFLSMEPLLEPVWLAQNHLAQLKWVIVGGESGPGARPMEAAWARSLKSQCERARVAFFMKQMGGVRDKRGDLEQLPEDLRIRQFPVVAG